jgi:dihydroxyacetone kinase
MSQEHCELGGSYGLSTREKLIRLEASVNESLAGLARLNSNIKVDEAYRVVYRANVPKNKVALISGGGSGHEVRACMCASICGLTDAPYSA